MPKENSPTPDERVALEQLLAIPGEALAVSFSPEAIAARRIGPRRARRGDPLSRDPAIAYVMAGHNSARRGRLELTKILRHGRALAKFLTRSEGPLSADDRRKLRRLLEHAMPLVRRLGTGSYAQPVAEMIGHLKDWGQDAGRPNTDFLFAREVLRSRQDLTAMELAAVACAVRFQPVNTTTDKAQLLKRWIGLRNRALAALRSTEKPAD